MSYRKNAYTRDCTHDMNKSQIDAMAGYSPAPRLEWRDYENIDTRVTRNDYTVRDTLRHVLRSRSLRCMVTVRTASGDVR